MRFDRLLLASAACVLMAGTVSAQTTTTTSTTRSSTGAASTAQPGANTTTMSNTTGMSPGAASGQTGATGYGSGTTQGGMTQSGVTQGGTTQGGAGTMSGAVSPTAGGAFQQITPASGSNIVAVLQASGQFTTLLKAIAATNLASVLERPGTLTVFAPTDAAFAALPPSQVATLMQPANASQLQQLVLLHVVNTPLTSAQLLNHAATNIPTVATGKSVHLDGSSGTLTVDGGQVLQSDVKASNGSIFVIGQVLSPSYTPPAATAETTTAAPASTASDADTATTSTSKAATTKSTSSKKRKH